MINDQRKRQEFMDEHRYDFTQISIERIVQVTWEERARLEEKPPEDLQELITEVHNTKKELAISNFEKLRAEKHLKETMEALELLVYSNLRYLGLDSAYDEDVLRGKRMTEQYFLQRK